MLRHNWIPRSLLLVLLFVVACLIGASGSAAQSLSIDAKISKDTSSAASSVTTAAFSTTTSNELLLAFVSSDGANNPNTPNTTVTGITGGGLTWQLVVRTNVQLGTSEIWRAFASAQLSNAKVTVSLSQSVASSVTVVSFIGADPTGLNGSGAIGAIGSGNALHGAPTATLVTTRNNSWVFGVGNDWDNAISRTLGPNQTLVHQYLATVNDTYWVQSATSPTAQSGTNVVLNDTAPATDRFNFSTVEVRPPGQGGTTGLRIDTQAASDKTSTSTTNSITGFSTSSSNELLLAFISADSTSSPNTTVTGIAGGGLTWQLVKRTNAQLGTAEVWRAFAATPLSNAQITATLSQKVESALTVVSFIGADPSGTNGSGAIGAVGTGNALHGAPTGSLVTTRNNSWIFAAGDDWDNAISRTLGPNQSLVHQYLATVNDTYWVQAQNVPTPQSGTTVLINDTAPSTDRFNLSLVEILPPTSGTAPPTITASASPAPNAGGWNNSPVTVSFHCTAGSFPIASCSPQQVVNTEGANQTITGTVTDTAGNTASASVTISIDLTPPLLSIASPVNGSVVTSATLSVTGSVSDALSGVAAVICNSTPATLQGGTYSCSLTLSPGANTIQVAASDVAGNASTTSVSVTLSGAPVITGFSPTTTSDGGAVTVTGSNFTVNGATPQVTLSLQGGGTIPAPVSSATATSITFVVPTGAATGPITVSVNGQSATTATALTIQSASTFGVAVTPGTATLLPGQTTTYQVSLTSTDGFTQLANLSVSGLPSGATASFQPAQITAGGFSTLGVTASTVQTFGASQLTITASAVVQGFSQSQTATVTLNVEAAGGVAFQGRVAVTNPSVDAPLVGLTVRFTGRNYTGNSTGCTASTTTDSGGNFVFASLPPACAGSQLVQYDPTTVIAPAGSYSGVNLSYVLPPGQVTTPGIVVHLPRVDNAETVMVTQGASTDQTFAFKSIPKLNVTVYAGTTFALADGSQPNPFPLKVVEIPYDRLPEQVQFDPTQSPVYAMSIEPFNSSSSQPVAVTFPNRSNTPPGTDMPLTSLNPVLGAMSNYGTGMVSADGTQVIPDPDPGHPGHLYGVSNFDWFFFLPPSPNNTNPSPDPDEPKQGDPVDPASGLLTLTKTDMSFGGARGQVVLTRSFRGMSNNLGPFGRGGSHSYNYFLDLTNLVNGYSSVTVTTPDGNQYPFAEQSNGMFTNSTNPMFAGAVISTPSNGVFNLRLRSGTVYQFRNLTLQFGFSGGYLMSITDINGNKTTFTRNNLAEITQITDPVGRSLNLTYNLDSQGHFGLVTSVTDPVGRTIQYGYNVNDASGTLASVVDAAGGVTRYGYDPSFNLTSVTDARGITYLTNSYDSCGRVTQQKAADGGVTTFTYTLLNPGTCNSPVNATVVTDPLGRQTSYHYNPAGFLIDTTDAVGEMTLYNRDPSTNLLLSVTDPLGRMTAYTYDSAGNTATITRLALPPGSEIIGGQSPSVTTSFTYDPIFNKLMTMTNPLGFPTSSKYDTSGNLITLIDQLNNQTSLSYDPTGELIARTDALQNATKFGYANGDVAQITDALGRVSTRVSDFASREISSTNPLGQTTRMQYGPLNQIQQITSSAGGATSFTYDPNGNVLSMKDALGNSTSYTYDNLDRVSTRTDPLGHSESYQYDLAGNLIQFTDRRGKVTSFSYDALNRKTFVSFGGGESTISFSYDSGGRMVRSVDSSSGAIVRIYDPLDRLIAESSPQGSVSYTYDAGGRRTSMSVSGQATTNYAYDHANRLTQMQVGSSLVAFTYDAGNRRTSMTLPNGVVASYGYDQASELVGITYQAGTTVLGNLTYSYDAGGRRTSVGGSLAATGLPNPLTSAAYNAANEVTQFGGSALSYDANGNLTDDGVNTYTWDARNHLVSISGGVSASFQYDPFGRRVSKTISGKEIGYVYDAVSVVQEVSGLSPTDVIASGTGEVVARTEGSGLSSFLTDALHSTIALTGPSGSMVEQYTYDPFGNTTSTGTSTNPYQYTAQENDGTGLYFYRNRYYSPKLQRFISEDPASISGSGTNLYQYAGNKPVSGSDPLGLWSPEAHDALIAHALAPCGVSQSEIQAIQQASRRFDEATGESEDWAFAHSMKAPGESADDGISRRNDFIANELDTARLAWDSGDTDYALNQLGWGLHPVMDFTSPAHTDSQGEPITWCSPIGCKGNRVHSPGGILQAAAFAAGLGPIGIENVWDITPEIYALEDQAIRDAYQFVTGISLNCKKQ